MVRSRRRKVLRILLWLVHLAFRQGIYWLTKYSGSNRSAIASIWRSMSDDQRQVGILGFAFLLGAPHLDNDVKTMKSIPARWLLLASSHHCSLILWQWKSTCSLTSTESLPVSILWDGERSNGHVRPDATTSNSYHLARNGENVVRFVFCTRIQDVWTVIEAPGNLCIRRFTHTACTPLFSVVQNHVQNSR